MSPGCCWTIENIVDSTGRYSIVGVRRVSGDDAKDMAHFYQASWGLAITSGP